MLKNRKILWGGLGLLAVVTAVVLMLIFVAGKHKKPAVSAKPPQDTCKSLTLTDAYSLLGGTVQKDEAKSTSSKTPINGIQTSICAYSQRGATVKNGKLAASIEVKEARTDEANASFKKEFNHTLSKYTELNVYGDKDFWDYDKAQINVLKGDKWYILTFGKLDPNARNLSQTEELADMLVGRY